MTSPPHTRSLHYMTSSDALAEYTDYVYNDEDEFGNARPKAQPYPDDSGEEEGQCLVTTPFPTSLTSGLLLLWDTASTAHIVGNAGLLDDYSTSHSPTTVRWGTSGNIKTSVGVGTLRTRNYLPERGEAITTFKGVLHVPDFGANILSVKQVADKRQGCGVLFSGGARFYTEKAIWLVGVQNLRSILKCIHSYVT